MMAKRIYRERHHPRSKDDGLTIEGCKAAVDNRCLDAQVQMMTRRLFALRRRKRLTEDEMGELRRMELKLDEILAQFNENVDEYMKVRRWVEGKYRVF